MDGLIIARSNFKNICSSGYIKIYITFGLECMIECHHLIEYTAKTPNIRFLIIPLIFPDFGCHNTRCADLSLRHIKSSLHIFRNPKIPYLHLIIARNKYILALQIPMQNSLIMYILNS